MKYLNLLAVMFLAGCADSSAVWSTANAKCPIRCLNRGGDWTGLLLPTKSELKCVCSVTEKDDEPKEEEQ